MMEQIEDDKEDHNVLARLSEEEIDISEEIKSKLREFVLHVFDHGIGKTVKVGRFLNREDAEKYINQCRNEKMKVL
jgi:inorganic pyrophosphatase